MQLDHHILIKSDEVNSTGLQAQSKCSACEIYCKEIQHTILSEQTNAKRLKKVGQKGENLQATQKLKKIPQCWIRAKQK